MRILLVEDEELVAEFLKRSLKKAGHEVDYAGDGDVAYQKASNKAYDAVVLDIVLPKRSGIDVCRQVRADGVTTPIIILSSMETEAQRVGGLDAGADDYMIKPFSYRELEARLRALHRRPVAMLEDSLSAGPITVNNTQHKVYLDNIEVELRNKEYLLLEYMIRHRDRVIPREEILHTLWGVSIENASNRVEACVKELRNKLGKDVIKTVHKTGYKLNTLEPIL